MARPRLRCGAVRLVALSLAAGACSIPRPKCPVVPPGPSGACWQRGRPAPPPPPPESTYCQPIDGAVLARVETDLVAALTPMERPHKFVVDVGCDAAIGVDTIDLVAGSGHGGSLTMTRLTRRDDGFDLRRLQVTRAGDVQIDAGRVDVERIDAALAYARVALIARPHRIELADETLGISGFGGSSDVHRRIVLADADGDQTQAVFSDYIDSASEEQFFPLALAGQAFAEVLDAVPTTRAEPSAADRALFVTLAKRELGAPDAVSKWWVREWLLLAAARLGTVDLLPELAIEAEAASRGDGGDLRRVAAGLAAIQAVSGWDPRTLGDGRKLSDRDAAVVARRECVP